MKQGQMLKLTTQRGGVPGLLHKSADLQWISNPPTRLRSACHSASSCSHQPTTIFKPAASPSLKLKHTENFSYTKIKFKSNADEDDGGSDASIVR